MPGLLRGVARTAVVAGTATAVSGRVQRRQAEKYATRDANIYAQEEQAYQAQMAQQQPVYQQPAAPPPPQLRLRRRLRSPTWSAGCSASATSRPKAS